MSVVRTACLRLVLVCATAPISAVGHTAIPSLISDISDPKALISPVNRQAAPVPLADLSAIRETDGAVWMPDGKSIVYNSDITGRMNIWKMTPGEMMPVQLSQSPNRQIGLMVSRDGATVYFLSDVGGDQKYALFSVPSAGGEVRRLTHDDGFSIQGAILSPDGNTIAMMIYRTGQSIVDIAAFDVKTGTVHTLTQEKDPQYGWYAETFSADGSKLLANRINADNLRAEPYSIDLASLGAAPAFPTEGAAFAEVFAASADGRLLAVRRADSTGRKRAGIYDVAGGKVRWMPQAPWDQTPRGFTADSRHLFIATAIDSRRVVTVADVTTLQETPLDIPPGFVLMANGIESANAVNGHLLMTRAAGDSPTEMWNVDPAGTTPAQQISHFSPASLNKGMLPSTQIIHYRSFDGTPVSAIVTMPFNLKRDGSNPAIVMPHGGPTGQVYDWFDKSASALASRGYIVIQPNFRGSTGYGRAFQAANLHDAGNGDLKDVMAAVDFLKATGYVDPSRIGITGMSYGGFLTLLALGKYPGVFAAGVDEFGILDWRAMYQNNGAAIHAFIVSLLGDPETNKALYDAASPLTYVKNIKAPLLILQGENDPRVPRSQSENAASQIKANGGMVEAVYYPDEGHGFAKPEDQADALSRLVNWFDSHMK